MTWKSTKLVEWGLQPRSNTWGLSSICLPYPLAGCDKWWRERYGSVPGQTWRSCTIDGRSIIYQYLLIFRKGCKHTWSFSWGTPVNAEIKLDFALSALVSQQHHSSETHGIYTQNKREKGHCHPPRPVRNWRTVPVALPSWHLRPVIRLWPQSHCYSLLGLILRAKIKEPGAIAHQRKRQTPQSPATTPPAKATNTAMPAIENPGKPDSADQPRSCARGHCASIAQEHTWAESWQ